MWYAAIPFTGAPFCRHVTDETLLPWWAILLLATLVCVGMLVIVELIVWGRKWR